MSKAENRASKMMTVEMFESDLIDMRDKYQVMTGGADQDHDDTERVDTPQGSGVNIIQKIWRKKSRKKWRWQFGILHDPVT